MKQILSHFQCWLCVLGLFQGFVLASLPLTPGYLIKRRWRSEVRLQRLWRSEATVLGAFGARKVRLQRLWRSEVTFSGSFSEEDSA